MSEFDKVALITLSVVAVGFGLWSVACFVTAASTVGLSAMVKGWLIAVGMV
jgi:hypothetical protein